MEVKTSFCDVTQPVTPAALRSPLLTLLPVSPGVRPMLIALGPLAPWKVTTLSQALQIPMQGCICFQGRNGNCFFLIPFKIHKLERFEGHLVGHFCSLNSSFFYYPNDSSLFIHPDWLENQQSVTILVCLPVLPVLSKLPMLW